MAPNEVKKMEKFDSAPLNETKFKVVELYIYIDV